MNDTLIISLAARQKELKKFVTPAPGMYEVIGYLLIHAPRILGFRILGLRILNPRTEDP